MSLQDTPKAERVHIGFFGLCNAGKSSLVNALSNQELSIVSATRGTTTDTVQKAMELLPIGPVVLMDTAGFDDEGSLGALRVEAARRALEKCDVAVLVTDATRAPVKEEEDFLATLKQKGCAHLVVSNKCDLVEKAARRNDVLYVSAKTREGIDALRDALALLAAHTQTRPLVRDLISREDRVLLVTPIDEAAPKGRIILPQQQTLRDLLDAHAIPLFCQPQEVKATLDSLKEPPALVITDSQAFAAVANVVPQSIPLTSFSILFARYKGELASLTRGAAALLHLTDESRVLISEGCTHHRSCGDIGTVKLPAAIRRFSKTSPLFTFTQGGSFPEDLSGFDAIIHCGGCMLTQTEMQSRQRRAAEQGVPMTNYGIALALSSGILPRALAPFPDVAAILKE